MTSRDPAALASLIKSLARELGFDDVGIAPPIEPPHYNAYLEWLRQGYAGEMGYLYRHAEARRSLNSVFQGVKSVVVALKSYNSGELSCPDVRGPGAKISVYAKRRDYHDVVRSRLYELLARFQRHVPEAKGRAVVDTAPVLERDFAWLAGLGWIGKSTMLLNKRLGTFTFIGVLLLSVELACDEPHRPHHCGTCTRCLDACPTGAFAAPYVLDARKCISYLTIELRGHLPAGAAEQLHGWLFGCDVCQDVCPWNRKAAVSTDPELAPLPQVAALEDPVRLLTMSDEELAGRIRGTPLERAGPVTLKRTAALLLSGETSLEARRALKVALEHPHPVVRVAAAQALRTDSAGENRALLEARLAVENDSTVRAAIREALQALSEGRETPPPGTCCSSSETDQRKPPA